MIKRKRSWKHKVKPCNDLDGASGRYNEKTLNSGKEKMKHLEPRMWHDEQLRKEEIDHLEEIRIRFIVCLSFIKLNWWQAMDFSYYLFFLKRIEKWHIANLRRSSWTTGWINMTIKEKECWMIHRKNSEIEWRKRMNHWEELEEQICSRGFRCKRTKIS